MAIDLPPVMPPQLASQAQIESSEANLNEAQAVVADIAGIHFRVFGNQYLSDEQLSALLNDAASPSVAITELTRRYYNAGHFLVGVHYYRLNDTVTVLVSQNRVEGLRGDPGIIAHFQGLIGDDDLELDEFDRARVLADLQSERAGYDYSISYEQHYDGKVVLEFSRKRQPDFRATDAQLGMSNRGSRFLGRYFGEAELVQRFSAGTELRAQYRTAFAELGGADDGEDYHELGLRIDQPTPVGLYGVEASYIRYQRDLRTTADADCFDLLGISLFCTPGAEGRLPLEAEVATFAATGEQVWRSNPVRRISLFERLEYIDSEIRVEDTEEAVLEENYVSAELGARYSRRGQWGTRPSYLKAELALKAGLSEDDGSFDTDPSNGVGIGRRTAGFQVWTPRVAYKLALNADTELAASFNAQLAGESQLPQQQQFVLGGMDALGAWLPGVLIGDSGYLGSVALQRRWQLAGLEILGSAFLEQGSSWFEDTTSDLGEAQTASDVGLRVTVKTDIGLESDLLIAAPIANDVSDEDRLDDFESKFFWRLRWRF